MDLSSGALLFQQLVVLLLAAFVAALISWIAYKLGYYRFPPHHLAAGAHIPRHPIHWFHVLATFAIFLTIQLVILPAIYLILASFSTGEPLQQELLQLQDEERNVKVYGWLNLIGIALTAISITVYFKKLGSAIQQSVIGLTRPLHVVKNLLFGIFSWIIAYPWIIVLGQLIGIIQDLTYNGPHLNQLAVKHLLETMDHPVLLWTTVLTIVFIVPCLEEVLFRGFLQGYFKNYYSKRTSILLTSCVFALFHYSDSQGIQNVELMLSLFLLSCYLGFIRERQDSIFASIGLHSTFNCLSIVLIFILDTSAGTI